MWSASSAARLYVGHRFNLVAVDGKPPVTQPLASGNDIAQALAWSMDLLPARSRIAIDLGAGYCPAVAVAYPEGLRGLAERLAVARAACGDALGLPGEEVVCDIDARHPRIAAAMPRATQDAVRAWADTHKLRVTRLRPLWSAVSDTRLAKHARAIALHEDDAVTVFGESARGEAGGLSIPAANGVLPAFHETAIRESLGLGDADIAHVRLLRRPDPSLASLRLPFWPGHWSPE